MIDIAEIANNADLIVNGYAFTKNGDRIRVLNLNDPWKAAVLDNESNVIETSMDDIELSIIRDYLKNDRKYIGD